MIEYAWIGKDKDKIFLLCLDILINGEDKSIEIKDLLSEMAKKLNFKIKKKNKIDLEMAVRNFVINPRGFVDSIEILYHSL